MPTTENLTLTTASKERAVRGGGDAVLARVLAPPPAIDKFPIVLGSNITFQYIANTMRESLNGYRQTFVDVLDEMLDLEGHGFSVLSKRILAVAGARIEFIPAKCAKGEEAVAQECCDLVEAQFDNIPYRTQHLATLLWALYYAITAAEIHWTRSAGDWTVTGLSFIHSRRLSYPFYGMKGSENPWDLHIWDQGTVQGWMQNPTNGLFGLRIDDYPNKFIVYKPQLRGNYPTREGLGRILVTYFALKRLVLRMSAQDFERFVKPWVIAYYAVTDPSTGKPRAADDDDQAAADAAMKGIGTGSLSGSTLPDSVKIEILRAATSMDQDKFLAWLDAAISKTVVGQTFTSEPGKHGTKGTNEQGSEDEMKLSMFDGTTFVDTLREQLFRPILVCNRPGYDKFVPTAKIHVARPDPMRIVDLATKLAGFNVPIDGAHVTEQVGLKLIDPKAKDEDVIRMKPAALTPPTGEPVPVAPPPGTAPTKTPAPPGKKTTTKGAKVSPDKAQGAAELGQAPEDDAADAR